MNRRRNQFRELVVFAKKEGLCLLRRVSPYIWKLYICREGGEGGCAKESG